MRKTAYVTGSNGFLGLNIIEQLLTAGWKVKALRRETSKTSDLDKLEVEQVIGDVLDKASLERTMPECVDAVFHVAADTGLWVRNNERQTLINVQGTRNVVDVALGKKAGRFIHTSSIGAFGKVDAKVVNETTSSVAMSGNINYYKTKFLAEQEVRQGVEQGLDAVILNPCHVIGPYDYNYTPVIFNNIKSGNMKGIPKGMTVLGHVSDYAKAHVAAYDKGRCGENYLLGGVHATYKEMFDVVGNILNVKIPTVYLPRLMMDIVAQFLEKVSLITNKEPLLTPEKVELMNAQMKVDSKKAENELGFSTCSIQEMFDDYYQWMRESGLI